MALCNLCGSARSVKSVSRRFNSSLKAKTLPFIAHKQLTEKKVYCIISFALWLIGRRLAPSESRSALERGGVKRIAP